MQDKKIIITDCDHVNIEEEKNIFEAEGFEYVKLNCITEDDLIEQCKGGTVFLNQYAPFTERVIKALLPEIKFIVRYGVGVNNIDIKAAEEMGVQVCNVPDYGMNEVADQAVALMLSMVRKTSLMTAYTKNVEWNYSKAIPVHRIKGSTVGIVGIGRIGSIFAKRIKSFDCKVIAVDPAYTVGDKIDGVEIVELDELLKSSDMISIHCPFTEDSKDMFNSDAFDKMKESAYLINTARGGIIKEDDLYLALRDKKIAGAALDVVLDELNSDDNKLFEMDNFECTPHMAWYSVEAASELKRKCAEEAVSFIKGEPVRYKVNLI